MLRSIELAVQPEPDLGGQYVLPWHDEGIAHVVEDRARDRTGSGRESVEGVEVYLDFAGDAVSDVLRHDVMNLGAALRLHGVRLLVAFDDLKDVRLWARTKFDE